MPKVSSAVNTRHSHKVNSITDCYIVTVDYLPLPSPPPSPPPSLLQLLPHKRIQNITITLNPNKSAINIRLGKVLINSSAMNSLIVFTNSHY